MVYEKYLVKRRSFIDGKLYYPDEVIEHKEGYETRKSLKGIGESIAVEKEDNIVDEIDEIKRGAPGKWKLPNEEIFTGKLAEAREYWELCKSNMQNK